MLAILVNESSYLVGLGESSQRPSFTAVPVEEHASSAAKTSPTYVTERHCGLVIAGFLREPKHTFFSPGDDSVVGGTVGGEHDIDLRAGTWARLSRRVEKDAEGLMHSLF